MAIAIKEIGSLKNKLTEAQNKIVELRDLNAVHDKKIRQHSSDNDKIKTDQMKCQNDITVEKFESNKRTYNIEKTAVAGNLIVKFVETKGANHTEYKNDTKLVINNMLKTMGIEKDVKIKDCFRFRKSAKAIEKFPQTPPVVLVKLESPSMKSFIFKNISKLGGPNSDFAGCSVNNEIPASFRNVAYEKEQAAKDLRKQFKHPHQSGNCKGSCIYQNSFPARENI
jgi:hypothetical protein